MRLTLRTNLAMRVLMYCAVHAGAVVRSSDIARACNVSANHLMQVVPQLHRHGFIIASRGRLGGVTLASAAEEISVGKVFRLFEAGVPFAECFEGASNECPLIAHCRLRIVLERALEAFYAELDAITLADLIVDNCGLELLLSAGPSLACSRG